MITPNFASEMRPKIEGGVVSEGGNPDAQDEDRSLDMIRDLSGLGNHIVVEGEDELPSHMLNSTFSAVHSSSEPTPEASRSSSPSVSMHLRHGLKGSRHQLFSQNHNYESTTEFLQLSCTPICYITNIPGDEPQVPTSSRLSAQLRCIITE